MYVIVATITTLEKLVCSLLLSSACRDVLEVRSAFVLPLPLLPLLLALQLSEVAALGIAFHILHFFLPIGFLVSHLLHQKVSTDVVSHRWVCLGRFGLSAGYRDVLEV